MRGLPPHRYESHGVCFLSNGHLQPHFTEKRKPRGQESLDPKQDYICSKNKSEITPRSFKCLPLPQSGKKQVEKGEGRKAYLLGEENLGGISSLFYRNPVQKDITVLRKKEGLERHPPHLPKSYFQTSSLLWPLRLTKPLLSLQSAPPAFPQSHWDLQTIRLQMPPPTGSGPARALLPSGPPSPQCGRRQR